MRVFGFVVMLAVTSALTAGGAFLLAVQTPRPGGWLLLASTAIAGYVIAPITLGSLLAFWDMDRSAGARRAYRRTVWAVIALQAISTILMCAYTALTSAPWWLTALFTGVAAALTVAAVLIGPVLRKAETPAASAAGDTRAEVRRDVRRITVTAVVVLLVTGVGLVILIVVTGDGDHFRLLAYAPIFAVMATGLACSLVSLRFGRRQRDAMGGDLGRVRDIAKVVIRGRSIPLSPEDTAAAARFAALSWVAQAYQLASFTCLFVALAAMQCMSLATDEPSPLHIWLLAFLAVTFVVLVPLVVVQLRRTRRYAIRHAALV